jgi:hypothetical protein
VGEGGKTKRMSEVVQRLSGIFEGEEMAKSDTSESGCNKGEGETGIYHLLTGSIQKWDMRGQKRKRIMHAVQNCHHFQIQNFRPMRSRG